MKFDAHLCGPGVSYLGDDQARRIFGESAEWIRRRGTMIGSTSEDAWEFWACYGRHYHVNRDTGEVRAEGTR